MGLANMHTFPLRECDSMKTTIKCIGKQQPSKQALDKFIEVYKKMVNENSKKAN